MGLVIRFAHVYVLHAISYLVFPHPQIPCSYISIGRDQWCEIRRPTRVCTKYKNTRMIYLHLQAVRYIPLRSKLV